MWSREVTLEEEEDTKEGDQEQGGEKFDTSRICQILNRNKAPIVIFIFCFNRAHF